MSTYQGQPQGNYGYGGSLTSPPPIQPNPYAPQTQMNQFQQQQQQQQQQQEAPVQPHPWMSASAPPARRPSISRSRSFDPSVSGTANSQALVSFDPYASTTSTTNPPAYNNYALPSAYQQQQQPPAWNPNEEMTTSPMAQYNNPSGAASVMSEMTMFTQQQMQPTQAALVQAPPTTIVEHDTEFSESSVDPALVAEQERLWQEIQDRRKMERVRGDGNVDMPLARIPPQERQLIPRTRSMPRNAKPKSQVHSIAYGGAAVLDPKKDRRKQTRKMKTASGAVGGAVVGGLILGPVGVVLGAGGGAAVSNKMAKSRDKRKQSEFEQKNFQRGADESVAHKGDGAFV